MEIPGVHGIGFQSAPAGTPERTLVIPSLQTTMASGSIFPSIITTFHGSCSICHHWHNKETLLLNDLQTFTGICCRNCRRKLFGLGGNSTHTSLVSQQTLSRSASIDTTSSILLGDSYEHSLQQMDNFESHRPAVMRQSIPEHVVEPVNDRGRDSMPLNTHHTSSPHLLSPSSGTHSSAPRARARSAPARPSIDLNTPEVQNLPQRSRSFRQILEIREKVKNIPKRVVNHFGYDIIRLHPPSPSIAAIDAGIPYAFDHQEQAEMQDPPSRAVITLLDAPNVPLPPSPVVPKDQVPTYQRSAFHQSLSPEQVKQLRERKTAEAEQGQLTRERVRRSSSIVVQDDRSSAISNQSVEDRIETHPEEADMNSLGREQVLRTSQDFIAIGSHPMLQLMAHEPVSGVRSVQALSERPSRPRAGSSSIPNLESDNRRLSEASTKIGSEARSSSDDSSQYIIASGPVSEHYTQDVVPRSFNSPRTSFSGPPYPPTLRISTDMSSVSSTLNLADVDLISNRHSSIAEEEDDGTTPVADVPIHLQGRSSLIPQPPSPEDVRNVVHTRRNSVGDLPRNSSIDSTAAMYGRSGDNEEAEEESESSGGSDD